MFSSTDPGADYRASKASISRLRRVQADAELARQEWLNRHRGIPADVLYDRETGATKDPNLVALTDAVTKAVEDVRWCRALVLACGEAVKGEPLADVLGRNDPDQVAALRDRAMAALSGSGR